ncbi:DUF6266 family protein [Pedobacter insulae]|uniref:Uncharacterized protein n=1 Tax=Pedobacter insulae TaxID=414048 RepID=A0A1I2Z8N1_9SPHI|nr:DUF6266 family protein [Pedobacter insulae]SFH34202.1 hypothetical protein SAMN04489864_10970 [Pedobacter insulae]
MATIKNGINGGFSGKAGTVIGYALNGQWVMRGLNKHPRPKPSKAEQLNRLKFSISQEWLKPLIDFVRIGFRGYQPTFQGFVAAKSYNHKNALQCDENGDFFINPELALVSFGTQTLPLTASVSCTDKQEVIFSWSLENTFEYSDFAMVLLYNVKDKKVKMDTAIAKRKTGSASLQLSEVYKGQEFHAYLAFVADDQSSRTNSMYLGKLMIN